jgi:LacI family transcriptional regulator
VRGRVTLRTIADEVGVNVSYVSRVLSRRDDGAGRTEAATRIIEAADRLGYVRDAYAASLRTQRVGAFGVLVPRLTDIVLASVYEAIEECATGLGYQTVVSSTWDDPGLQRSRVETMLGRRVDGLILGDARLDTPLLDELAERGVPFVLVNRRSGDHVAVTMDDVMGGRLAATHLADLGHRCIGLLAGAPYASTGRDRRDGALAALAERGIEIPDRYVIDTPYDAAGGHAAAVRLLSEHPRVTAVFAVNDFTAIGAMGAIRDLGMRVGEDIALVGYNDIGIAAELPVPLTSVRNSYVEMGQAATRALLGRLSGQEVSSLRLAPQLVVRQSSDPTVISAQPVPRRE